MKKINGLLGVTGLALALNYSPSLADEQNNDCSKPLPEITAEDFGTRLYEKVRDCDKNARESRPGNYWTRNILSGSSEAYFELDIALGIVNPNPAFINLTFREGDKVEDPTYDIVDTKWLPKVSSTNLDSICEIVAEVGYDFDKKSGYSNEIKGAAKQDVCKSGLSFVRDYYNNN